jgi:UDP-2,3-diacylglucosamine hydrolase
VAALFISDLHLTPARPDTAALFRKFLSGRVGPEDALYILGDLFEYWAGDDDLGDPFNGGIAASLAATARQGTPVRFMHGNRDFLAGDRFAAAARIQVLSDPFEVTLNGVHTVLTHGDALCTDDTGYQAFRERVRKPEWVAAFLARPLGDRRSEIERLRSMSEAEKQVKPAAIMDVNARAVSRLMRETGCRRLIHGHTHRQGHHLHAEGERWVLPEWHGSAEVLVVDERGARFEPV